MSVVNANAMWDFQDVARIILESAAWDLFSKIDPRLKPRLFLLGVNAEKGAEGSRIAIEPEDHDLSDEMFQHLLQIASRIRKSASGTLLPDQFMTQQQQSTAVLYSSIQQAIPLAVKESGTVHPYTLFVSYPVVIQRHLVFAVLELDTASYKKHYAFRKHAGDMASAPASLLEATIHTFLTAATQVLTDSQAGKISSSLPGDGDFLRDAGRAFIRSVCAKCDANEGGYSFFDNCNTISSLLYEGEGCTGQMILAEKHHYAISPSILFSETVRLSEHRKVRKLLELTDSEYALLTDGSSIYGIGSITQEFVPEDEDLFVITFSKHFHWRTEHDGHPLITVAYNHPYLPPTNTGKETIQQQITAVFPALDKAHLDRLTAVIRRAMEQEKGTMLVISDGAWEEAERLKGQCISLNPVQVTESMIAKLTAIDGALMMAPDCTCHAIGVILDGIASEHGDSSRGARFNSAHRYYNSYKESFRMIVVVISEDGMVDFIPQNGKRGK